MNTTTVTATASRPAGRNIDWLMAAENPATASSGSPAPDDVPASAAPGPSSAVNLADIIAAIPAEPSTEPI